jgi:ketosteroid isomerase-like protein
MNKIIITICLGLGLLFQSCTSKNAETTTDKASTEKEILAVIDQESRDFYKKNHADWSKHYVQNDKVFWACVERDVTLRASGWNDLSQFVATWMKENPEPIDYDKAEFKVSDVKIDFSGDLAFVSMKSSNLNPDGTKTTLNANRTMIKENNAWKILSMTSYPNDSPKGSTSNVYVHGGQ